MNLRYAGKPAPLLRALRECAGKDLRLDKAKDVETVREELERAMARQEGGSR